MLCRTCKEVVELDPNVKIDKDAINNYVKQLDAAAVRAAGSRASVFPIKFDSLEAEVCTWCCTTQLTQIETEVTEQQFACGCFSCIEGTVQQERCSIAQELGSSGDKTLLPLGRSSVDCYKQSWHAACSPTGVGRYVSMFLCDMSPGHSGIGSSCSLVLQHFSPLVFHVHNPNNNSEPYMLCMLDDDTLPYTSTCVTDDIPISGSRSISFVCSISWTLAVGMMLC